MCHKQFITNQVLYEFSRRPAFSSTHIVFLRNPPDIPRRLYMKNYIRQLVTNKNYNKLTQ